MMESWPDEHIDAMKALLSRGLSSSEIAAGLNARFQTSYSRNAVIGKKIRLGIRDPNARSKSAKSRETKNALERKEQRREKVISIPRRFTCDESGLRAAEVVPLNLSLLELAPGQCRWPYGDGSGADPYRFCGHPMFNGWSYCERHAFLAMGEGTTGERNAHKGGQR